MHGQMVGSTQTWGGVRSSSRAWLSKAAVIGVVAGVVMAMVAMMVAAFAGDGFWAPPRAITGTFFGEAHAGGGFAVGPVIVGMMVHMMLSAMFGVGYVLLVTLAAPTLGEGAQVVAGLVWGLLLWAMNTLVLGPLMPGGELMTAAMPAWTWVMGHLLFGAVLGLLHARWRRPGTTLTGAARR